MQSNGRLKSLTLVGIQLAAAGFIVLTGQVMVSGLVLPMLLAASLALGLWALFSIKLSNLKITPDVAPRAELITKGPFRFIRHPMYSALLLATLALVMDQATAPRISAWFILFVDILFKLSYEEKLLSSHFKEYESYRQRTKRLIPSVF